MTLMGNPIKRPRHLTAITTMEEAEVGLEDLIKEEDLAKILAT